MERPTKRGRVSRDRKLYSLISQFTLSDIELRDNGFPSIRPVYGSPEEYHFKLKSNFRSVVPEGTRQCCRCFETFAVDDNGHYGRQGGCNYHLHKKPLKNRFACCQGNRSSVGCQSYPYHVHRHIDPNGFLQTMAKPESHRSNTKIYAVDCEMIYTEAGLELANVTVVDTNFEAVYETLVRPQHKIIDYNTRYSGITKRDLRGVNTTLEDVQDDLLELFSDKTVLIGHSLESDLIALKMVHRRVVDTSVMFENERGPQYKYSLKNLMKKYIQKTIQDDEGGHDSKEDAESCMELVLWNLGY